MVKKAHLPNKINIARFIKEYYSINELPTIDGPVKHTIKEGTQPGDTYVLRGKGIPDKNSSSMRGDHTCKFIVEIPTMMNESQKNKLRDFEGLLTDKNYSKKSGFFQKVKNFFK